MRTLNLLRHLSQFCEILVAFGLMLEFRFNFDSCSSSNLSSFHFHAQDLIRLRFGLMFEFRFMLVKESWSSSTQFCFGLVPEYRFAFVSLFVLEFRFVFVSDSGSDVRLTRTRIGDCGFVALWFFPRPDTGRK